MAGGIHALHIVCMPCLDEGRIEQATRTREGFETDHYRCAKGHEFGVDYSAGPLEEPEWPPPPDILAMVNH